MSALDLVASHKVNSCIISICLSKIEATRGWLQIHSRSTISKNSICMQMQYFKQTFKNMLINFSSFATDGLLLCGHWFALFANTMFY